MCCCHVSMQQYLVAALLVMFSAEVSTSLLCWTDGVTVIISSQQQPESRASSRGRYTQVSRY